MEKVFQTQILNCWVDDTAALEEWLVVGVMWRGHRHSKHTLLKARWRELVNPCCEWPFVEVASLPDGPQEIIRHLARMDTKSRIVVCDVAGTGPGGRMFVFDVDTAKEVEQIACGIPGPKSIACSRSGTLVAIVSRKKFTDRILVFEKGEFGWQLPREVSLVKLGFLGTRTIRTISISPNDKFLIIDAKEEHDVCVVDLVKKNAFFPRVSLPENDQAMNEDDVWVYRETGVWSVSCCACDTSRTGRPCARRLVSSVSDGHADQYSMDSCRYPLLRAAYQYQESPHGSICKITGYWSQEKWNMFIMSPTRLSWMHACYRGMIHKFLL